MKIFTKLFLALAFLSVYITGYGANLAFDLKGEGVYVPKSSAIVSSETHNQLASSSFGTVINLASFNAGLSKILTLPKNYKYNFTANAAKESSLGLRMINTTAAFDDGQLKPTLNAYPNPTRGIIGIRLVQTSNEVYKITLSNTIGQVVKVIKVPESAHNSEIKLDISTYPAGIYFYSLLVNDKMVATKRLILQQ